MISGAKLLNKHAYVSLPAVLIGTLEFKFLQSRPLVINYAHTHTAMESSRTKHLTATMYMCMLTCDCGLCPHVCIELPNISLKYKHLWIHTLGSYSLFSALCEPLFKNVFGLHRVLFRAGFERVKSTLFEIWTFLFPWNWRHFCGKCHHEENNFQGEKLFSKGPRNAYWGDCSIGFGVCVCMRACIFACTAHSACLVHRHPGSARCA